MEDTATTVRLTGNGALKLLNAAAAKAREMNVPQCISVVDAGGHLLAFLRMDGAFVLSIDTSLRKAMTAASYGEPTGNLREGVDLKLAIATEGKRINLPGPRRCGRCRTRSSSNEIVQTGLTPAYLPAGFGVRGLPAALVRKSLIR